MKWKIRKHYQLDEFDKIRELRKTNGCSHHIGWTVLELMKATNLLIERQFDGYTVQKSTKHKIDNYIVRVSGSFNVYYYQLKKINKCPWCNKIWETKISQYGKRSRFRTV